MVTRLHCQVPGVESTIAFGRNTPREGRYLSLHTNIVAVAFIGHVRPRQRHGCTSTEAARTFQPALQRSLLPTSQTGALSQQQYSR